MADENVSVDDVMRTLTPHIAVSDASAAIDFYCRAFGAVERMRMQKPGEDCIVHAELRIGDATLMLHDDVENSAVCSPAMLGGSSVTLHLYVDDVDAAFARAIEAGAEQTMALTDMFWGDRYGRLRDPFGHHWSLASHVEDLSEEEVAARAAQAFASTQE